MSVQEMIKTHPHPAIADQEALSRCIDECFRCAATCIGCADACLAEQDVKDLVRCIRLDVDCADICETTGGLLTRQTAVDTRLARDVLEVCARACDTCAEECDRHAEHHDHCRVCADACRRCAQACNDLLSTIG